MLYVSSDPRFTAEKALAVLQARSVPNTNPPASLVLSPFPPSNPPTALPPPNALPRLIKQLPPGFTDSQLYDIFRPFGALASVRAHTQFGADTGVVEFWSEDDARQAEEAMHCAEVEGHNIAVQIYTPRRASGTVADFNAAAPTFVPVSPQFTTFSSPLQVCHHSRGLVFFRVVTFSFSTRLLMGHHTLSDLLVVRSFMVLDNRSN